jgi:hypothetical protein
MVESAPYEVLEAFEGVEVRRYPTMVLAQVDGVSDDMAFRLLFRYITGENRVRQDIAMTVPVISTGETFKRIAMTRPVLSGQDSFSFVLPSSYSITTAPQPLNDRVRLVEVRPRTLAALRFSGRVSDSQLQDKQRALLEAVRRKGLRPKGEPFLMRYNGPGTPGFLRRNEVAVELEPAQK